MEHPQPKGRVRHQHRFSLRASILNRAVAEALERRVMLVVTVESMHEDLEHLPHEIVYDFSGDVESSLSSADLHLENLMSGDTVSTTLSSYGPDDLATFTASGGGMLVNGNYQSTIFADAVIGPDGLPMSADGDFTFFFLQGDIAGESGGQPDRLVGLHDFNRMQFGVQNASYSDGDFNCDGSVDLQDWNFLANHFGQTLAETPEPGSIAVSQGPGENTLNWNFANWQLAPDITGFRIQRSLNGQTFEIYHDLPDPAARQWTDDAFGLGLPPGTRIWYRVRAYGGTSGGTGYTPKQAGNTVMPPPENVMAELVSSTEVLLTWDDVTTNETSFDVEVSDGTSTWIFDQIPPNAGSTATYLVGGLYPTGIYSFRVRAWGPALESIWTLPTAPVQTPAGIDLAAPTNLQCTNVGLDGCTLTWTDNSTNETGFIILKSEGGGALSLVDSVGEGVQTAPISGLQQGMDYAFVVRAVQGNYQSRDSNMAFATTEMEAPLFITAVEQSETSLALSWAGGSAVRQGYEVEMGFGENPTYEFIGAFAAGQTTHTVNNILPSDQSRPYQFRVRTFRGNAHSDWVYGSGYTQLPAPTGLQAEAISPYEVNLSWSDNSATETGIKIGYANITGGGTVPWSHFEVPAANARGYTFTNLQPDSTYQFVVSALRDGYESGGTQVASATTEEAPTLPPEPDSGPYKVFIGGITRGDTSYSHESGELVASGQWVDAESPDEAVFAPGVISGTIDIRYSLEVVESFTWPNSYYAYYDADPYHPPVTWTQPLRWDGAAMAFVGVIGLEDWTDNDKDDWIWPVWVYPPGPVVAVSTPDAIAGEEATAPADVGEFTLHRLDPDPGGSLDVEFHPLAGTATHGKDYQVFVDDEPIVPSPTTGRFTITMPAEQSEVSIEVRAVDDVLMDDLENVFVYPLAATGFRLVTELRGLAAVAIQDEDMTRVKEVVYSAANDPNLLNDIKRDDTGVTYAGAAWLDANDNGNANDPGDHKFPIAYTRSGVTEDVYPTARPKFKLAKPIAGQQYKVRGHALLRGALGIPYLAPYFGEEDATLEDGILTANQPLVAAAKLPDTIYKGDMTILWQIGVVQGQEPVWQNVGFTSNTLYLTGIDLDDPVFHTVLDIGCAAALGKAPTDAAGKDSVMDAIAAKFETRELRRAGDDKLLKYWGSGAGTGAIMTTAQLLTDPSGDGRCNAFQQLLIDCAAAQGVTATGVGIITGPWAAPPIARLGAPYNDGTWRYAAPPADRGFKVKGMPAQGSGSANAPHDLFSDHAVVEHTRADNKVYLYDPSYGGKPLVGPTRLGNEAAWTSAALLKRAIQVEKVDGSAFHWLEAPLTVPPAPANVTFVYP